MKFMPFLKTVNKGLSQLLFNTVLSVLMKEEKETKSINTGY